VERAVAADVLVRDDETECDKRGNDAGDEEVAGVV
jgi:hypothetical protein